MKMDVTAGILAEKNRLAEENARLTAENERLRVTLSFYASLRVWFSEAPGVASYAASDKGQRARAALTPEPRHDRT